MEFSQWTAAFLERVTILFEWEGATPLAITISFLIASLAIYSARDTTKRKNSIDILFVTNSNEIYRNGIDLIRNVHFDDKDLMRRYAEQAMRNDENTHLIRYVLNFFEHLSIGINQGIYDKKIIEKTIRQTMVSRWEWSYPYIERRRNLGFKKAYIEYQKLIWSWTTPWWKKLFTFYNKNPT